MSAVIYQLVPMAELPNRIRYWRKARRWTLQNLAEKLDCSIPQVSDLELGNVTLSHEWMRRIADALDVQPADLLRVEEGALTPEEKALVDRYRAASPDQQEQLQRMADVIVPWRGPDSDDQEQHAA